MPKFAPMKNKKTRPEKCCDDKKCKGKGKCEVESFEDMDMKAKRFGMMK